MAMMIRLRLDLGSPATSRSDFSPTSTSTSRPIQSTQHLPWFVIAITAEDIKYTQVQHEPSPGWVWSLELELGMEWSSLHSHSHSLIRWFPLILRFSHPKQEVSSWNCLSFLCLPLFFLRLREASSCLRFFCEILQRERRRIGCCLDKVLIKIYYSKGIIRKRESLGEFCI